MLTPVKPNYEKKPLRIYVSKKTGRIFPLSEDETHIELDKPLEGISLLWYKYDGENNAFKVYDLKESLRESKSIF